MQSSTVFEKTASKPKMFDYTYSRKAADRHRVQKEILQARRKQKRGFL